MLLVDGGAEACGKLQAEVLNMLHKDSIIRTDEYDRSGVCQLSLSSYILTETLIRWCPLKEKAVVTFNPVDCA